MKAYLQSRLAAALRAVAADAPDFDADAFAFEFQTPNNPEHGDLATNAALQLARPLRRKPREIAEALVQHLDPDPDRIEAVEIAGPGFINVRFSERYLARALRGVLEAGADWGRTEDHAGQKAIVEYVSANPTGPLTVGHGRNAVLGDTLANLLAWTGYEVQREYYFNDAGRQMRVLGQSVRARYRALARPETPTATLPDGTVVPEGFPEDGYLGGYIGDIAQRLYDEHGDALLDADEKPFKEAAEQAIFADIEATLARIGVRQDSYFNEHTLYSTGRVWEVVDELRVRDLAYEQEGAVWFRTGRLGKTITDEKGTREVDTVLVKSSGEPTYRLPDIAYHLEKLSRGFDLVLDVFGADHIATYPDVLRGIEALGGDASKVDVLVYQFVTLVRGGQPVKMSTRKATYVTLDELMDEVGEDVTRFFFLMRSPDTHLEFDLDLAKEASDKNPVFYLQYAHARICSILRKAAEVGLDTADLAAADLALLTHPSEAGLMKEVIAFPDAVRRAAETRGPHKLAVSLRELAEAFSQFYRDCKIVGEDEALARARLALAEAARQTLANGLAVLGISAPEQM